MAVKGRTWNEQGYCSKLCASRDGANPAVEPSGLPGRPSRGHMVEVACPQGHRFEVLASFSGCIRQCPECGAKTPVP
jgi:hypothetical protein